jgi:Domain of unknown function (DUF6458)
MGIGVGIFLLALGAILTFAVDWTLAGLDLHVVGWILMAAGAIGLVLFFYFWNRRRAPRPVAQQPQMRAEPRPYRDPTPTAPQAPVVASLPPAPVVTSTPVAVPVVATAPVPATVVAPPAD